MREHLGLGLHAVGGLLLGQIIEYITITESNIDLVVVKYTSEWLDEEIIEVRIGAEEQVVVHRHHRWRVRC